jgi:Zn-dependent M28 family amino/carboxypeptidase
VEISPADLDRHIDVLTALGPRHHTNPRAVTATLAYLNHQLAGYGYGVVVERYGPEPDQVNLLVERPGSEPELPWLEVGAHWDSVERSPGADDNASGVAGVLEVARVLAGSGQPRRGIRLCLFGGEEGQRAVLGFEGSTAHLSTMDSRVAGGIVLEMIGYRTAEPGSQRLPEQLAGLVDAPDTGDFIAVLGDERSADYVARIEAAARRRVPSLPVFALVLPDIALPLISRSDQVPYWQAGLKGVMITDTSEYRTPHYHQPGDVLATLDLDFAAQVTAMVAASVVDLTGPWS